MPPRRHTARLPSRVNRVAHAAGASIGPHQHDDGQLTLAIEGTVRIQDDAGWHLATPGNAVWVPPRRRHSASYPKSCELIRMHLPASLSGELPDRCALLPMSSLATELVRRASRLDATDSHELSLLNELLLIQLKELPPCPASRYPTARTSMYGASRVTCAIIPHPARR